MAAPRNDEKANAMYAFYCEGHSLERVAMALGITRQSVYKMFAKRGFALRQKLPPLPFVLFNGRRYTRRANGYYAATDKPRTYLHRDIWERERGPIPDGYDIHHKDDDKAHNRIGNFELIEKADHARLHPHRQNQYTKRNRNSGADADKSDFGR